MSAAASAPPPPPHRVPVSSASNGFGSPRVSDTMSNMTGREGSSIGASGAPTKPLRHIRDLVARAEKTVEDNRYASIDKLLQMADISIKQSQFYLELHKIDQAYVEYVTAYQTITETIPHAKDAPILQSNARLDRINKELIRKINLEESKFAGVRDAIKADNLRSAIRPSAGLGPQSQHYQTADGKYPSSSPAKSHVGNVIASQRFSVPTTQERDLQQGPQAIDQLRPRTAGDSNGILPSEPSQHDRTRPASGPESEGHLSERFAKLRMSGRPPDEQINHIANGLHSAKYVSRRDAPSLHMASTVPVPAPNHPESSSPLSPSRRKADLSKDLPQPPSPTYLSSRNGPASAVYQPVRSTRSSLASNTDRPPSAASMASVTSLASSKNAHVKHLSQESEDSERASRPSRQRRKSVHRPRETDIDAKRLFDYLSTYHVLLIDIRSREDYDAGHIFTSQGICVEPAALRPNMSAEELQEALVLSPEEEQLFFDRRDTFDLVIYYNQSSTTNEPTLQNPALRYLNEALLDYNQEKPLNFPPIQLNGGLDAWIDLMGTQSLQMSRTVGRSRNTRPLARRPPVKAASKLEVQRRRRREYNPLDPEEERKWRERARSETFMLDSHPPSEGQALNGEQPSEVAGDALDGFDKRFPEVLPQVRDSSQQHQAQTSQHNSVPSYPPPPVPSRAPQEASYVPAVPSRPPPAVPRPSYGGVSERISSQASAVKPTQLAPYVPQRLKRIPRTGLHNFGATCYMNATIQCMSATIDLTSFFFDQPWQRYVQHENWKGSKGILPEYYSILLRNLWESADVDTIRPTNFRKFCARINKEWGTDRQQDAKEFFDFLIDILHEDLNTNWRANPVAPLTVAEEAVRERLPPSFVAKEEWTRSTIRDLSTLTDIFAGQHMSRLQCTTCGHSSTTYETFYSISVEIPTPPQGSTRGVNVYDCLASYCASERLSSDDAWRCPRCAVDRIATKRMTITRAPRILVLHFKRFSAGHSEKARKIHTPVDFPLHNLDLQPYMLPPPSSQDVEYLARKFGVQKKPLDTPESMRPPYKYDAYAVTRHIGGTMASGHYIGLVQDRARGVWREFNDDRATDFVPEKLAPARRLQNEQAYIVFYQRQQAMGG